jgi:hypothetical protein
MTPTSYLWNHKANRHQFLFANFSVNLSIGIKRAVIQIIEKRRIFLTLKQIPRIVETGTRWERKCLLSGKEKHKKKTV